MVKIREKWMTDLRRFRVCSCGKYIYGKNSSSIIPKSCPACQYASAIGGNKANKGGASGRAAKKTKKKTPRQSAMKDADDWFSRYIRIKYAKQSGNTWYCECYTCKKPISVARIQNGHWQRRGYKTVRFDPNNARPQCLKCNYYESGKPELFEIRLITELGEEEVDRIKNLAQEIGEDNEIFYLEQAAKYEKLTMEELKNKGIDVWWKR
jgi:hypothetical protein